MVDASIYVMLPNWIPAPSHAHFLLWERLRQVTVREGKKERIFLQLKSSLSSQKGIVSSRVGNAVFIKGGFINVLHIWAVFNPLGRNIAEEGVWLSLLPGCTAQSSGDLFISKYTKFFKQLKQAGLLWDTQIKCSIFYESFEW